MHNKRADVAWAPVAWAPVFWTASFLALTYSGYIKGSPFLSWMPVDLTLLSFGVCCIGVAFAFRRVDKNSLDAVKKPLILWAFFVPGVLIGQAAENLTKSTTLFSITIVCATAPIFLLADSRNRRYWLVGHLVVALIFLVGLYAFPDTQTFQDYGRLNLEGTTTITTARAIGAGALVALMYGLHSARHKIFLLPFAIVCTIGVASVGSKGPFVALLATAVIAVSSVRLFRKKWISIFLTFCTLAIVLTLLLLDSTSGASRRVLSVFFEDASADDPARRLLYETALKTLTENPLGLGWGEFQSIPKMRTFFGENIYPHNIFLEIFAEGGWIAGVCVLAFFIYVLVRLHRATNTPDGAALFALAIYWIISAQFSGDINGNRMTWAAIGLGLAVLADSRRNYGKESFEIQDKAGSQSSTGQQPSRPSVLRKKA